jgi:hypothetical protein
MADMARKNDGSADTRLSSGRTDCGCSQYVVAEDPHLTSIGQEQGAEDADERGLPRPVGADHPVDLARVNVK